MRGALGGHGHKLIVHDCCNAEGEGTPRLARTQPLLPDLAGLLEFDWRQKYSTDRAIRCKILPVQTRSKIVTQPNSSSQEGEVFHAICSMRWLYMLESVSRQVLRARKSRAAEASGVDES